MNGAKIHKGSSQSTPSGQWIPTITEPEYVSFKKFKCECGSKFKYKIDYQKHFVWNHILGYEEK